MAINYHTITSILATFCCFRCLRRRLTPASVATSLCSSLLSTPSCCRPWPCCLPLMLPPLPPPSDTGPACFCRPQPKRGSNTIVRDLEWTMPLLTSADASIAAMWNFTSLGLPFSKYSAILAKSPPNKIPKKFYLLRKFPQNPICLGLGLDSELARNPAMCLVHNWMAPYKHKVGIPLVSMDDAKSCHKQFLPVFCSLLARQCRNKHAECDLV